MSSPQQMAKKPHQIEKPNASAKHDAKEHKVAAQTAHGAARVLEKAVAKGYSDQKSALKPKDKHAARELGPHSDDKKKLGVAEAVERAHEEHDATEGKQDHPLHEAKALLVAAAQHAEKKADKAHHPDKHGDLPEVMSKHDEHKAEKKGADKKQVKEAKKAHKKKADKHSDKDHQAAGIAAVAKDKAKGKKDDKAHKKLKGKGSHAKDEHKEHGHGSPAEALAAETVKAVKNKKAEKKGKKKPAHVEHAAADHKKKEHKGHAPSHA